MLGGSRQVGRTTADGSVELITECNAAAKRFTAFVTL